MGPFRFRADVPPVYCIGGVTTHQEKEEATLNLIELKSIGFRFLNIDWIWPIWSNCHLQGRQNVFTPLDFCHISLCSSLKLKWIKSKKNCPQATQKYHIMTKWIHVFRIFSKLMKNENLKCLASIRIQPPSQYFVEAPLAMNTASSLLGYVCISFAHLDLGIFSHCSLEICSRFSQRWGASMLDWRGGGGSRQSYWRDIVSVRFVRIEWHVSSVRPGCDVIQIDREWRSCCLLIWGMTDGTAEGGVMSKDIWLYLPPLIVSSTLTSLPIPVAGSHGVMLLPPCFTVGMVFND